MLQSVLPLFSFRLWIQVVKCWQLGWGAGWVCTEVTHRKIRQHK